MAAVDRTGVPTDCGPCRRRGRLGRGGVAYGGHVREIRSFTRAAEQRVRWTGLISRRTARPRMSEQPFVYANFVSSLDGRIAVVEAHTGESYVLEDLTSSHDWRLFQELQAQADCMVTHGGYLRALAARKFEDILQVGVAKQALDIGRWRNAYGLTRQPAIAIVAGRWTFPCRPRWNGTSSPCTSSRPMARRRTALRSGASTDAR